MLPFGVTIPATVPQGSEIPEGLMNNPVYVAIGWQIDPVFLISPNGVVKEKDQEKMPKMD
jgi:hypothetical protein